MKLLLLLLLPVFAFCLVVGRRIRRTLRTLHGQLAAYRRGNYREQLKIIEGFRVNGSEPSHYLFFRGAACFELGRLQQAEQDIRQSLEMETKPAERTLCRDQLARIHMEQGRWDEAEAGFRECIAESPERGGGHRGMAEVLLRRGEQYEAAVDAARLAVAADRARKVDTAQLAKEEHDTNLSESLAFLGWALAQNQSDAAEVEHALNEALNLGVTAKPILTELHFCAGHAYAALGNTAESTRHFQSAAEIDPVGNYGRLSRSMCSTVNSPA